MFWRKTYISTARIDHGGADLANILDESRRNNHRDAVTGVLLFAGSSFYQTIEGYKDEVEQTFERIEMDNRHDGVIVLQSEPTRLRAFAAWSMAHRDLPSDHQISNRIAQLAAGAKPAFRTKVAAQEMDTLITSFLTV